MKNKLTDLNDHLFMQLERLGNEDLDCDALEIEIDRAKAIAGIADRVIHNAALVLRAQQAMHNGETSAIHPMIGIEASK